ncbi:type VI secretion system tip protein VgrG, partial [bacterium]|nr:type VI secretion system tip protein VgrG [bacterium]
EYCVQYRESDFNFICRLLEEEGIFYFFQHNAGNGKELLVFGDSFSAYPDCAPLKEVIYRETTGADLPAGLEHVSECRLQQAVCFGKTSLNDFNYEKPSMLLITTASSKQNTELEIYDYPGKYNVKDVGEKLAKIRLEELNTERIVLSGSSNCHSFAAGAKMTLVQHPRKDINKTYLVVSVHHMGSQESDCTDYDNHFECIPVNVSFVPPRTTPRPTVKGSQTATVVGPSKEKIYFDEFGRVKVQFHWDREGKRDENTTCWVRVSQGYAGANHGMQFMPLIGDEVIVDFLEGDPDKPIITGRVYNGNNMPRLKPENKVQNVIYTPYQHRLMLDDKGAHITLNTGGGEVLFMGDGDKGKSDHGNNIKISTADKHFMHMAEGKEMKGILISTLKDNMIALDDKEENITIQTTKGHIAVLDDKNKKIAITSTDGHSITINDKEKHITAVDKSGDNMFKIDISGKKLIISTKQGSIDILAPMGTITMKANQINAEAKMDVKVKGMNISQEAQMAVKVKGLNVTSEASMAQKVKGTMTNVEGGAMTTIKGALVKIN